MTFAVYARYRGVAKSAVSKAVAQGRISAIERGGKRSIDPKVADIQWAANTRARADSKRAASQPAASGANSAAFGESGYNAHRARREAAEALRAELQARQLAGELVELARVDVAVFDAFRALRDRMQGVARDATAAVLGKSDAREIEATIAGELRKALEAFEQRDVEQLRARLT